ncbi:MAG: hypothetical protein IPL78_09560 [Chloroflexi bacterium]|nr:hypothetical protein [Chloroflexota bacterium]
MTVAFAQQALTDTFGTVAPSAIVLGNMTVVPDMATLYAAYDQWCIDNGVTHADGSAWAAGDKLAEDTAGGFRMNAFAEPSPGTSIWVDATGSDPTATVHEMLHINTAADFRAAVGEIGERRHHATAGDASGTGSGCFGCGFGKHVPTRAKRWWKPWRAKWVATPSPALTLTARPL